MPSRPLTLALYLSTDSCSDLSTCWGLYYFHVAPALVGTSAYDKPTCAYSLTPLFHTNLLIHEEYAPLIRVSRGYRSICYIFRSGLNTEINITMWHGNSTPMGGPIAINQVSYELVQAHYRKQINSAVMFYFKSVTGDFDEQTVKTLSRKLCYRTHSC